MVKIKSPNPSYTGVSASLHFVNGEAETVDKWLIEWFENKGYEIDDSAEREAKQKAKEEAERKAAEEKVAAELKAKEAAEAKAKKATEEASKKDEKPKK